jgi:hypothetical protein
MGFPLDQETKNAANPWLYFFLGPQSNANALRGEDIGATLNVFFVVELKRYVVKSRTAF